MRNSLFGGRRSDKASFPKVRGRDRKGMEQGGRITQKYAGRKRQLVRSPEKERSQKKSEALAINREEADRKKLKAEEGVEKVGKKKKESKSQDISRG